jgi:DNA-binding NarL/FixJ family response regulator
MPAARVMIVDDHSLVRAALRRALGEWGMEVVAEAASGHAAVSEVELARPDAILLDNALPDGSGVLFLPELRRLAPAARIVLMTIAGSQSEHDAAIEAGASAYVTKDVGADELLDAITANFQNDAA